MPILQQEAPSKKTAADGTYHGRMFESIGYGTSDAKTPLRKMTIRREFPTDHDVLIRVLYCGVCHSDVHQARDEWHNTVWPCVPGHEIVGKISALGAKVTKYNVGDIVGVGCMINSCGHCRNCTNGEEQYCQNGFLSTYNGPFTPDGSNSFGGYSDSIVANEHFVLAIPPGLDPAHAAPILCAGVTTYSPLKHWNIQGGERIAIVGVGGLGHLAIQIAKAMGASVTAITSNPQKAADARDFGAEDTLNARNADEMKAKARSFDYVLSTIPTKHDTNPFLELLRHDGVMTIVGCLEPLEPSPAGSVLAFNRLSLSGSLIGSIAETREALEFCAAHDIAPRIEKIALTDVNTAFDNIVAAKVRYRYVIDMAEKTSRRR